MHRVLVLGGGFGGIATAVALRIATRAGRRGRPRRAPPELRHGAAQELGARRRFDAGRRRASARGAARARDRGRRGHDRRDPARGARGAGRRSHDRRPTRSSSPSARNATPAACRASASTRSTSTTRARTSPERPAIDAFTGGRVVIGIFGVPYPCPPGPYELALLLGERLAARGVPGGIFMFTPQSGSLPVLGDAGCAAFDGRLANEGITLRAKTNATAVEPGAVVAADTRIPFDLLLGVPPHRVPEVVTAAGLAEPGAWVKVDPATLETALPGRVRDRRRDGDPPGLGHAAAEGRRLRPCRRARSSPPGSPTSSPGGRRPPPSTATACASSRPATAGQRWSAATSTPRRPMSRSPRRAEEHLAAKHAFESDRLAAWFGA